MSKRLSMILPLMCVSALTHTRDRAPNASHLYQLKRRRNIKPEETLRIQPESFTQLCCACAQLKLPTDCKRRIITGTIPMPSMGKLSGEGSGYTYLANAELGTVEISFPSLHRPIITATAQDAQQARTIEIIGRELHSATLSIPEFTGDEGIIIDFHAIQLEETTQK